MSAINAAAMLAVWERGLQQSPLQRALLLLVAAHPESTPAELAALSIGERDRRLLQLRQRCFGARLANTAVCPRCAERLEWENSVADLFAPAPRGKSTASPADFHIDDYHIYFRLPNSLDIARVMGHSDAQTALIERCIARAERTGTDCAPEHLPPAVIEATGDKIAALDPQAQITIDLTCPACSHEWPLLFDIAGFLWAELNAWAERMLHSVHRLARGYGWSEREILDLSPVRRQLYLGMLET